MINTNDTNPINEFMGNNLAVQATLAALAREILHNSGSDAFVRAEEQASRFVQTINRNAPFINDDMRARALTLIRDIFALAEDLPRQS